MLISSRMRNALSFSLTVALLCACGAKEDPKNDAGNTAGANNAPAPKLEAFTPQVGDTAMDKATAKLLERPKVAGDKITVQHVLIAFQGAQRATVTRTKDEAKVLAQKVWTEARSGINFKDLMAMHSTDSGPGEYEMGRNEMVPGFREMAWRLEVDEIGVAPFHQTESPYGWHIIKRIK